MSKSVTGEKPLGLRIGESVFCVGYLITMMILGFVFLTKAIKGFSNSDLRADYYLYTSLAALTLVLGDAFHLIPRIVQNVRGEREKDAFALGLGNLISSITMTITYIFLFLAVHFATYPFYSTEETFMAEGFRQVILILLLVLATVRVVLCIFPHNRWFDGVGDQRWALLRNVPFTAMGIVTVVYLVRFYMSGVDMANGEGLFFSFLPYSRFLMMAILVVVSFLCYLPVVLAGKKKPKLGMLMIPKTICYIWLICLFFDLT